MARVSEPLLPTQATQTLATLSPTPPPGLACPPPALAARDGSHADRATRTQQLIHADGNVVALGVLLGHLARGPVAARRPPLAIRRETVQDSVPRLFPYVLLL